jgi:hypothetical protein
MRLFSAVSDPTSDPEDSRRAGLCPGDRTWRALDRASRSRTSRQFCRANPTTKQPELPATVENSPGPPCTAKKTGGQCRLGGIDPCFGCAVISTGVPRALSGRPQTAALPRRHKKQTRLQARIITPPNQLLRSAGRPAEVHRACRWHCVMRLS